MVSTYSTTVLFSFIGVYFLLFFYCWHFSAGCCISLCAQWYMNAVQHCVCVWAQAICTWKWQTKVRKLVSVTENGEADVISGGCAKTGKAKVHSFTLIKHVSVFQIGKINRCNSIQIWRNSHHLTFGKWGQVIDWIIYESNYSLKGTRFLHGAWRHERCVFSGGINQLMFRQLRVTLASKIPELHLTARHRCAKLIELFLRPCLILWKWPNDQYYD